MVFGLYIYLVYKHLEFPPMFSNVYYMQLSLLGISVLYIFITTSIREKFHYSYNKVREITALIVYAKYSIGGIIVMHKVDGLIKYGRQTNAMKRTYLISVQPYPHSRVETKIDRNAEVAWGAFMLNTVYFILSGHVHGTSSSVFMVQHTG